MEIDEVCFPSWLYEFLPGSELMSGLSADSEIYIVCSFF
jgi:hypothetical protein